jgi:hypothetical protein
MDDDDGPADERCDWCGRWADACRLDPCLPDDLNEENDR